MEDLVATALGKAGLVWLSVGQGRPQAVWHEWHDDAALVVVGGGEQPDPVADATRVTVSVPSKDNRARLVTFGASVDEVRPDDARWDTCVAALGPNRLNTSTSVDQGAVWAEGSRLLRLVPDDVLEEHPGSYDSSSGAAPVLSSPATTTTWRPFHLRGRRRKRFRL